jgi:hypothetical protein
VLAAMFVLTYVATVSATCLNVLGRGWLVTVISLSGLLLNPFLNAGLVRQATAHLTMSGAAGMGAASAMLLSETLVTLTMTAFLGAMAFDRRSVDVLTRTLTTAALVVGVDRVASPLGSARLALDAVAYVALALALGAVRWGETLEFVRLAVRRRDAAAI